MNCSKIRGADDAADLYVHTKSGGEWKLSIGEFSKIGGVSTKTLRYYDEIIGLIRPDEINPENGYRYYSIGQLKTLFFIHRLKAYSFSLDEIKTWLACEGDEAEEKLYNTLIQKKIDIQNFIYPRMLSSSDYAAGYGMHFQKLYEVIASEQLTIAGTPMTIYHSPEYNPAGNDTEFAIPILEPVKGTRDFSGGLCAKSLLQGDYTELTAVYANLRQWVEYEGYALVSSPYEVYVTDPYQSVYPNTYITEVYFPIAKKLS
ncbi:GyrI-like small molecule binding domain-containing protein [Paenibacillus aquistagni]|uniref:GyrI-like small molecule binding domain-containing protein n=1 Tax=Paenibacillus aquistagni TaxID=1852522 RepID=A0A1X7J486_9BACL|nr:GyrI-like small molecule binding domain-containing protein [Paenibacillus aquistagni]